MTTVWLREVECDHAPSYGLAVFSTIGKAQASVPSVKKWRFWVDARRWEDASAGPYADCWVITEMGLDPESTDD